MRRSSIVVGAAALVGAGVVAYVAVAADRTRSAKEAPAGFETLSTWVGRGDRVDAGAPAATPRWGAILVEARYEQSEDPWKRPKFVSTAPRLFATPTATGPLHIVSVRKTDHEILLRSSSGNDYAFSWGGLGAPMQLVDLGRALDPAHLPKLPRVGAVVAAAGTVVLASFGNPATDAPPTLYGHLAGFSLPARRAGQALQRPLLGPDGTAYRIDARGRRLVRLHGPRAHLSERPKFERGACAAWPAPGSVVYRSCPHSIVRMVAGRSTTVLRNNRWPAHNFEAVLPSPDGRTLLVESDYYACGTHAFTSFVPSHGGRAEPVVAGNPLSRALGWIDANRVLVTDESGDCDEGGGVYLGDRRVPGQTWELVASDTPDATLWRG